MTLQLDQILRRTGMKQARLAEALGVTPGYISALVHHDRQPSLRLLQRMAEVLDVSVAELNGEPHGRGMAEEDARPFTPQRKSTQTDLVRQLAPEARGAIMYRIERHMPGFSLLSGDLLIVEPGGTVADGALVLVNPAPETGQTKANVMRAVGGYLVSDDITDKPRLRRNSEMVAVVGRVVAVVRAPALAA